MYISNEERDRGLVVYKYILRYYVCFSLTAINDYRDDIAQVEEDQLEEIKERERVEQQLIDEVRLSSCFVEFLNEHQLFESMFLNDKNGSILRLIGEEAEELINE